MIKYARAVGGAWTADATWSTTSGGAADTTKPTAADDAVLDAASGAVTIDSGAVCRSLDCNGYTGTLTHTSAVTLTIGDGTAGAGNIALRLVAGMTYTLGGNPSSSISFVSTSATVQTVNTANKTTGNITFNGAGGSWQIASTMTTGATGTVTLTNGTLDTNGQSVSWGLFNSNNTNTRTLTLGASAITITGTGTAWTLQTTTGLTFNANTSSITMTGASPTAQMGSLTYNNFSMTGSGTHTMGGAPTFANFTRTGTAAKADILTCVAFTVTNTLTLASNSDVNRLLVQSNGVGTARTITAANVVVTNTVDFMDITGAGAATWTVAGTGATALGDCGGNSGITFTTPATQTWSGTSGGNWSANAWSGRVPLPQDDVVISSAFSASQTVTADMPRLGKSIDWTGATGTSLSWAINSVSFSIFGSLTLASGMGTSGNTGKTVTFAGRGAYTLTTNGVDFRENMTLAAFGGTLTLQDNLLMGAASAGVFTLANGVIDLNNKTITSASYTSGGSGVLKGITFGTGTWNLTATSGTVWNLGFSSGFTMSAASGTIAITTTSASTRTFIASSLTYGAITYTVAGSTGTLVFTGSPTIGTINFSDVTNARTLQFTAGTTTNVTNWNVNGTSGKLMSVQSVTAATHTLNFASQASSDYLNLTNSIATGSAAYAGANSTNSGGNSGWIFTAPPSPSGGGGSGGSSSLAQLDLASLARL